MEHFEIARSDGGTVNILIQWEQAEERLWLLPAAVPRCAL